MNELPEGDLIRLSEEFERSMKNNHNVFGIHTFRKHTPEKEGRSVINASLWDVMSTGLSRYTEKTVEARKADLQEGFFKLMKNDEFLKSTTYGSNDVKKVRDRFNIAKEYFKEILGDPAN